MTKILDSYPAMKSPGVEWLGELPVHWEVRRLKYLLEERNTYSIDGDRQLLSVSQYSGVTQRKPINDEGKPNTRAESLIGYKCVDPDDLIVNIMLAWNGSMGVSKFFGITSPAYCVYRFKENADPWYFHYLLSSSIYKARIKAVSTGVVESRLRLYTDDLYRLESLLPSFSEQIAIARYLDHMDRCIARHINAKKELIELLEEYKQVLVSDAVTGRFDVRTGKPYPAYKPSDIKWLGDMPAHWEVRRLRNIARTYFSNVDKLSKEGEHPVRLCNYSDVYHNDHIRADMEFMEATATAEEIERFRLHAGDVLITKDSELWDDIGIPAFVESTDYDLVCGYHLALLRPLLGELYGKFLCRALSVQGIAGQLFIRANGVTRYGLSQAAIRSVWLPVPPLTEQAAIAYFLDKKIEKIREGIAQAQSEIDLLREYRTRLIADVVTGKLDVREAAAALPEFDPLAADDRVGDLPDACDTPASRSAVRPAEAAG